MNNILKLIRGDTAKYKFQRLDANGNVILTAADEIYFTVKETPTKEKVVFQKTIDDMTLDEDGTYHFIIEPTNTNGLQYGNYVYDLEIIVDGVKTTVSYGTFQILPEVTWVQNEGES